MMFNMGRRLFSRAFAQPGKWAFVILALHLAFGGLYSVVVPPWEAHDEWAHYKFVEYVARRRALPSPDVRLTNEYEYDEANQPPLYYIIAALPVILVDTSDEVTPDVNPYFDIGTGAGGINAAIHHPAQERFPWRGTILALHLARWVSLAISLIGLTAIYKLGRLLAPARPAVALIGLTIAAFSPQYLFISSVVTNDVLITVLGCVVAWLGVEVVLEGLRPRPALGLALAIGLAFVTKLSAPALAPFVLLALIAGAIRSLRRGGNRLAILLTFAIPLAGGLVIGGWWLARNVRLTGQLLPRDPWVTFRFMDRWFSRTGAVEPMKWAALPSALRYGFRTFWASFGWGNLEAFGWVYWLFTALCLTGLVGLAYWAFAGNKVAWSQAGHSTRPGRDGKIAAGLLLVLAASVLFMAAYRDFDYGGSLIRGRYLLPALAAVAALIALGLDAILSQFPPAWGKAFLPVLAGVLIVVNLLLPLGVIRPAYAPPPMLASAELLPGEQPLSAHFGDAAELVAYGLWPETVRPGDALAVTLLWRVLAPLDRNYTVGVHLLDAANEDKVGELNIYPERGNYATTLWRPGDLFRETYWVTVGQPVEGPVMGRIKVALFADASGQGAVAETYLRATDAAGTPLGNAVIFGRFKLAPAILAPIPAEGEPGLATLGGFARLRAATWQVAEPHLLAGSTFTVTLTWDALARPPADYQVFLHVEGPDGPLAFGDGSPQGGAYPTGLWDAGERIVDPRAVQVPSETPAGDYRLVAGLYDMTGPRVAAAGPDGQRLADDQIELGRVTVARLDRHNYIPLALGRGANEDNEEP